MAPGTVTEPRVVAVCVSAAKGTAKAPCPSVEAVVGHGIAGDAHAGPWHRQVSLLALASIEFMKERGADVGYGSFGENVVVDGLAVHELPVGTLLRLGDEVTMRVTQIGKECHTMCAIGQAVGECIMPRRGIFCEVVTAGTIRPGDGIEVVHDVP